MTKLTVFYDGQCPICSREIKFLKSRNQKQLVKFVDITQNTQELKKIGLSYEQAMKSFHGVTSRGQMLKGVKLFIKMYKLLGFKTLSKILAIPFLFPIWRMIYGLFAKWRYHNARKRNKK